MKHLAIYYSWPSVVNHHSGDLEAQVASFAPFDIIVLGGTLQSPEHGDHGNTKDIISGLSGLKDKTRQINGYVSLSPNNNTDSQLVQQLEEWGKFGVQGILFDLVDPEYGTQNNRLQLGISSAREAGLNIIFNTYFARHSSFLDRVMDKLESGDSILIEPFGHAGTDGNKEYPLPSKMPPKLSSAKAYGVAVLGITTFDPSSTSERNIRELFQKYSKKAEELGMDAWGFTNCLYSASGPHEMALHDYFTEFQRPSGIARLLPFLKG